MVYDEALFRFATDAQVEFLPWRVWISIWTLIIAIIVAAFQGSFVVKFFTKFTKDIFASFIATVFIIEALQKTAGVRDILFRISITDKFVMINFFFSFLVTIHLCHW